MFSDGARLIYIICSFNISHMNSKTFSTKEKKTEFDIFRRSN